jgi:hypothetical protein
MTHGAPTQKVLVDAVGQVGQEESPNMELLSQGSDDSYGAHFISKGRVSPWSQREPTVCGSLKIQVRSYRF